MTTLTRNESERFKDGVSSKKKAIPMLQHMVNLMHHDVDFELILVIKLLVYKVNCMSRATHLSSPIPIR